MIPALLWAYAVYFGLVFFIFGWVAYLLPKWMERP